MECTIGYQKLEIKDGEIIDEEVGDSEGSNKEQPGSLLIFITSTFDPPPTLTRSIAVQLLPYLEHHAHSVKNPRPSKIQASLNSCSFVCKN